MGLFDFTIPFLILLGILIFVHEFGHFIVAKKFGIKVLKFSLGFGPPVFKRKVGETEYMISAIPLGGYVKLFGQEPGEEIPEGEEHRTFNAQSVWRRIAAVAAGPGMNIVLALVLFTALSPLGTQVSLPIVGDVSSEMPAELAGIKPGDRVEEINGEHIESWEHLAEKIAHSGGQELKLKILRGEEILTKAVVPMVPSSPNLLGAAKGRAIIGIVFSGEFETIKEPLVMAPWIGIRETALWTYRTADVLLRMVIGQVSPRTLGGPIAIAKMAGETAKTGIVNYLFLIAVLSVNLAVLNLLPIPVLDGGHIFFFLAELALGRPVSLKNREIAQQVGLAILLLLMVYVIYNDVARIVIE